MQDNNRQQKTGSNPQGIDWDMFADEQKSYNGADGAGNTLRVPDIRLTQINDGELVIGTVTDITSSEVTVNVGNGQEGAVLAAEFRYNPDLKTGDQVEVLVEAVCDRRGQIVLSHRKARSMRCWDRVSEAYEQNKVVRVFVLSRTKGGMLVDLFGMEAFIPGSLMDIRPVRDFDQFIGKTLDVKIISINSQKRSAVVSRKAILAPESSAGATSEKQEKNKRHKDEKRFIGKIRFFDDIKGFGFIDTTRWGMDESDDDDEDKQHELFFSRRDLKNPNLINGEGWVTFTLVRSGSGKRDNARNIRGIRIGWEDFNLAMNYDEGHSVIIDRSRTRSRYDFDVTFHDIRESVIHIFMGERAGRQIVFDHFVETVAEAGNHEEDKKTSIEKLPNTLSDRRLIQLLTDPEAKGVKISDKVKYEEAVLLTAMYTATRSIQYSGLRKEGITSFELCISRLGGTARKALGAFLSACLSEDPENTKTFLDGISSDAVRDILGEEGQIPNPQTRAYLLERGGDVELLLDGSVIDMWNRAFTEDGNDKTASWTKMWICRCLSSNEFYRANRDAIFSFVASSEKAGDDLLFGLFNTYPDSRIIEAMICRESFIERAMRLDKGKIYHILARHSLIPSGIKGELLVRLGVRSIIAATRYDPGLRDELLGMLPDRMSVDIYIDTTIHNDATRQVGSWYGGYFTWGEGMKNEKYKTTTYRKVTYSASFRTGAEDARTIGEMTDDKKTLLREYAERAIKGESVSPGILDVSGDVESVFVRFHTGEDGRMAASRNDTATILRIDNQQYEYEESVEYDNDDED